MTTQASDVSSLGSGDARSTGDDLRVLVDGVEFDRLDERQVIGRVLGELAEGRGGCLVTPNLHILRKLRKPAHAHIAAAADLVVADGMPVVWASRLQRQPLPERVTGSSLIWSLSRAAAGADRSVFLLGGDAGIAEVAAMRLGTEIAGLRVAGWHFPPFGFESRSADRQAIVSAVLAAQPDIVYVGLGFPRQEILMSQLFELLPQTWFVGCGASLTFVAGDIARAPELVQRLGLEWAHRLAKEPRRLARRYLVEGLPYAAAMLSRSATQRVRERPRRG